MIIAVERSTEQSLHVNPHTQVSGQADDALTWSVRTAGEFVIVMNNQFSLPVIVRHPQRFNDSRSFITAFKREFLNLLELSPIPHAKIRLVRDDQFSTVQFVRGIDSETALQLQTYQDLLTGPDSVIDWEKQPSNAELALQLAEETWIEDPETGESFPVMDIFEDYVMMTYHVPAHPTYNEHNRSYLYRSSSLSDIMNAVAVNEHFLADYRNHLERRGKSDQIIDRDTDVAADYCSYCEANGVSPLDDLTLPYYYLLHYDEDSGQAISDTRLRGVVTSLREFARFMRLQALFNDGDFSQFNQATNQGWDDQYSQQRYYHLQQIFKRLQRQLDQQRQAMVAPRDFAKRRITVRVTLRDYQPEMWRTFEVGGDTRLDKLCLQVLASFNAKGNHLFNLTDGQKVYQLPAMDSGLAQVESLADHWLGEFHVGDQLVLNYDFGDSWRFQIQIEDDQAQPRRQNNGQARLLAGFGSGIIEDIGGTMGLTQAAKDDPTINQAIDVPFRQAEWGDAIAELQQCYQ